MFVLNLIPAKSCLTPFNPLTYASSLERVLFNRTRDLHPLKIKSQKHSNHLKANLWLQYA